MTSHILFRPLSQPEVRRSDRRRLAPHLSSSGALNEVLVLDTIDTRDLQRMLVIEASRPEPRPVIVKKLTGRILSRERHRLIRAVLGE